LIGKSIEGHKYYNEATETKTLNEIRGLREKNLDKLNMVPFLSKEYNDLIAAQNDYNAILKALEKRLFSTINPDEKEGNIHIVHNNCNCGSNYIFQNNLEKQYDELKKQKLYRDF
jgi:hypothetical protein